MGTLCLYLFALSAFLVPELNRFTLIGAASALLLSPAERRTLGRRPVFYLTLFYLAYVGWEARRGLEFFPDSAPAQWAGLDEWLPLAGFLAIAAWVRGDCRRIDRVLVAALVGWFVGLFRSADWRDVFGFRADWQTGFHVPAQTSGLIAATALFGLLLLLPRALLAPRLSASRRVLRSALWLLALYLSSYLLVVSQARGTWLAAMLVGAALYLYHRRTGGADTVPVAARSRSLGRVAGALVLLLFAVGLYRNADPFMRRIAPDFAVARQILSGGHGYSSSSSFSFRYHAQKFGLEKWLERPLLGWGAGSSRPLIESSGRRELYKPETGQWLGRMHNAYIEILVRFGLVGLGLLGLALGYGVASLYRARREAGLAEDYWRFFLAGFGLLAVWGLSSTFTSPAWQAYWMLLMGIGTSFSLNLPHRPGDPG